MLWYHEALDPFIRLACRRAEPRNPYWKTSMSAPSDLEQTQVPPPETALDDAWAVASAARIVPLERSVNFRDLGGYRTQDGRRIKRGKLYRSGDMSGLADNDLSYLATLGVRTLCDLRSTSERTRHPNEWVGAQAVRYWARDYEENFGDLRRLMMQASMTAEQARAAMIDGYGRAPYDHSASYRELFLRIAADEIPLAFHCTAGKDRTGVGAALILEALNVPRATIVADYVLSDDAAEGIQRLRPGESEALARRLAPGVVRELLRADACYLEAAFAAIEAGHGSVSGYLSAQLGVDDRMLRRIRSQLLE